MQRSEMCLAASCDENVRGSDILGPSHTDALYVRCGAARGTIPLPLPSVGCMVVCKYLQLHVIIRLG